MREAGAQVNLTELRQRLADLHQDWQNHTRNAQLRSENSSTNETDTYELIAHELLSSKMREAQLDCDKKILSQDVMDLSTQKQVLHNQIKRQDDEIHRLRQECDEARMRENELRIQFHEAKNSMHDGQLKVRHRERDWKIDGRIVFSKKKIQ